jgi:hypothetical protein
VWTIPSNDEQHCSLPSSRGLFIYDLFAGFLFLSFLRDPSVYLEIFLDQLDFSTYTTFTRAKSVTTVFMAGAQISGKINHFFINFFCFDQKSPLYHQKQ